jgi:5-methylcytosine-specific restriction endonuclease McrA
VREYVFERDRYQCQGCFQPFPIQFLQVDHIIPLKLGGSNDISNLQTLCQTCNLQKRDRLDQRFKRRFT